MSEQSPLMAVDEVARIFPGSEATRWRAEKIGLFPKRVRISKRKIAYLRSQVEAWARDPEGWARNAGAADG